MKRRLYILTIMIAVLVVSDSHAAKVCVANKTVYELFHKYKSWYCYTSGSTAPSVSNVDNHGGGNYCWCFSGGKWWLYGSTDGCFTRCSGWCQV